MSKLNFTSVDKAFTLGSTQIKDTQEEIQRLTKLILESNNKKPIKNDPVSPKNEVQDNFITPRLSQNYMRVGYPDSQQAVFGQPTQEDNFDYNLMKVIGHPKFDDIVKNYALINHPEWLLKETVYVPQSSKSNFTGFKSNFGNTYSTTICSNIKNYVIFFIVCMVMFLSLSLYFN